ncbi:MAG: lamin tail domain-containing protein, partial [Candidatus Nealsonbacteria bacterium]|nr:lamin tail domain-containing protein [Candidatus Nealsonbacteria bacterium]
MSNLPNGPATGDDRRLQRKLPARGGQLAFETLEDRRMLDAGPLVISEFMAINNNTIPDKDGDYSDWIEIHNPTNATVHLNGWALTDDTTELTKWQFPARSLEPNAYLLVFASDKNLTDPAGEL